MNMKITSTALAALMIAGTTSFSAFASMGSGTVVIGTKAFDFEYANSPVNAPEITAAIIASGGVVYVKDFGGNWLDNSTGLAVDASAIPSVTYTDVDGVKTTVDTGDVTHVGATVSSVSAIDATTVAYGTAKSDVVLPAKVTLNLSDSTTKDVDVTWTNTTYDANVTGAYTFTGTYVLPEGVTGAMPVVTTSVAVGVDPDLADIAAANVAVTALETQATTDLTVEANLTGAEVLVTLAKTSVAAVDTAAEKEALTTKITAAEATITAARTAFDAEVVAETAAETAVTKAETSKIKVDIDAATTAVVAVKDTVKAAAFTARITAIAVDVVAPTLKVADSSFTDYKTLTIALSEKVTGTPVVKVNGTVELAANVALAADGMSLTVTRTAGFVAGNYAVIVNGLTDIANNAMVADATLAIVKDASYPKTFTNITNAITNSSKVVYLTAVDQYGKAFDIATDSSYKLTATLNGMPLTTEATLTTVDNMAKITLTKALVENDAVVIKVEKFDKTAVDPTAKLLSSISSGYIVGKDLVALPNTILGVTSSVDTILAGDAAATLTADVRDQYNNPADLIGTNELRWIVENGGDLLDSTTGDLQSDKLTVDKNGNTATFKAVKPGTITISAYNMVNGAKSTYTVVVGATKLTGVNLTSEVPATKLNNEVVKYNKITQNDGAVLTPDMIKFNIVAKTKDTLASDVTVTAALRGGSVDATKNDIVISAKTTKAGTYEVTPYVGESLDKATVKAPAFDVTTTIDQKVTSIDAIAFNALELKTGKDIVKNVVFRNQYNEVVVVDAPEATVITPANSVTAVISKDTTDAINPKNILTLSNATKGTCQVTLSDGSVFKSYTLAFTAPTFTKIDAGADITGVVAGDQAPMTKYQAVKFLDQDNIAMPVKAQDLTVSVTKPDGTALADANLGNLITLGKTYSVDEAGVVTFVNAAAGDNVVAYKVLPHSSLAQGTYIVKIANKNADADLNGKIVDTFTVTVGAKRETSTIEVAPVSTSVALNGQAKVKVTPKDQYGQFIAVGAENIAVTPGANFTANSVTEINKDGGEVTTDEPLAAYEVTLTGVTKGTNDVAFTILDENAIGTGDLVAKKSMTVDSVANLVNNVAVDTTDVKALYSTNAANPADIQLNAIAKDVNGAIVPVDNADLSWSIKSVTGKIGANDATVGTVGLVGLHTGLYAPVQDFKGTVTLEVKTANMKVGEITLNLDNAAAMAKTGTTTVVNKTDLKIVDADATATGIQVALDGVGTKDAEANGAIVLKLNAVDQFGTKISSVDLTNAVVMSDDSSVVTPVEETTGNTITLTAKSVGTANVYVQYNGDTIKLEVAVNQEALDASPLVVNATNALTNKIADAGAAVNAEGITVGKNIVGTTATLNAAIATATTALNDSSKTVAKLTNATATLNTAITAYNSAKVVAVDQLTAPTLTMVTPGTTNKGSITGYALKTGESFNVTSATTTDVTVDAITGLAVTGVKAAGSSVITVQVISGGQVIKTGTVTVTLQ